MAVHTGASLGQPPVRRPLPGFLSHDFRSYPSRFFALGRQNRVDLPETFRSSTDNNGAIQMPAYQA